MYLIVLKRKDTCDYTTSNGIGCAARTLCKITGKKLYESDLIFMCKVPDKEGDETLITKYFQKYPQVIPLSQYLYNENDAAEFWGSIGGTKNNIGYGLITRICNMNNVKYVLVNDKDVN